MRAACTILIAICAFGTATRAAAATHAHARDYTVPHSYARDYPFDGDEWEEIGATDVPYKYTNDTRPVAVVPRSRKAKASAVKGAVIHALNQSWNNLKGIGKSTSVLITWYAHAGWPALALTPVRLGTRGTTS